MSEIVISMPLFGYSVIQLLGYWALPTDRVSPKALAVAQASGEGGLLGLIVF